MRNVRDRGLKIESVRAERRAQEEGREQRQEPEAGSTVFNSFLEFTGGAWPFLVGGLPCQVDSGNERDLSLLNSPSWFFQGADFLEGLSATSRWKCEAITGL
jgi:hypothetical protein